MKVQCNECGKFFEQKVGNQVFCSENCRKIYYKKEAEKFKEYDFSELNNSSVHQETAYEYLRFGILKQAVVDYKKALKRRDSGKSPTAIYSVKALEIFFLSSWGQFLSNNNGKYIIEKVNQEHEKEI